MASGCRVASQIARPAVFRNGLKIFFERSHVMIHKLSEKEPLRFELPNGAIIKIEAREAEDFIVQRENLPRELTIVVNSFPSSHVLQSMFVTVRTKNYQPGPLPGEGQARSE
jgi:hypothetical protein